MRTEKRKKPRGRPFRKGDPLTYRGGRRRGSRNRPKTLTLASAITAIELSQKGQSRRHIARLLQASPAAVAEALDQSKKILQLCAPCFSLNWIRASEVAAEKGDHRPAMDLLLSLV